jgi:hypothetical protein
MRANKVMIRNLFLYITRWPADEVRRMEICHPRASTATCLKEPCETAQQREFIASSSSRFRDDPFGGILSQRSEDSLTGEFCACCTREIVKYYNRTSDCSFR